ncbi:hypothetical protein ACPRNU_09940 [Chromobacterium vaccinii]|uniref:hypothetical protein n=1 Tax=Chromobacterium vaccinii TaxID=1108595 RepID=UPI000AFD0D8C|nr:hypothetical protein [Chromobacterium vaccinii]NHQ84194.1 hypothetical protein [Chromobacterium vaccinii]
MNNQLENFTIEAEQVLNFIHENGRVKIDRLEEEFSPQSIKIAQNNPNISSIPTQDLEKNKTSYWLCSLKPRKESEWS